MIEHLLWAKDSDQCLGTSNAYEVVSAFGNLQTGDSGRLGQLCFSEIQPESWAGAEGLHGCSFQHSALTPATPSFPAPPFACGSSLCQGYHHVISPLSTEAGLAGITPSLAPAWPTVHKIIYITLRFPHRHGY